VPDIPIPLINYVHLIRNRKSPYYEIGEFLIKEMEERSCTAGQSSQAVYTVNPRIVKEKIEKKVGGEKLTTVNICRTVLALLYGAKLNEEKDFFVTTTSGGRRSYHIKVNSRTLSLMSKML
jgi:hypothetical protein